MRMFLASYRFGAHRDELLELVGTPRRVAVIANAADAWPRAARSSAVTSDAVPLQQLGFTVDEFDLRSDPVERLADYPFVWVRGGNTFVLRAQLTRSGGDVVLRDLIESDAIAYAGYSAGACVTTPSLHGLELADDPAEVLPTCGIEPIWTGLNLVDRAIVPHVGSDDDCDRVAAEYRRDGISHWALADDQVVVVDGPRVSLL